jgi:hypothetical protein
MVIDSKDRTKYDEKGKMRLTAIRSVRRLPQALGRPEDPLGHPARGHDPGR